MKKEAFNIKFKEMILSNKAKVITEDGFKVRIICWDRKGFDRPIVGLVELPSNTDIIIDATITGIQNIDGKGPHQTLYVEYDPIGISKKARVVYSLLKCPYLKKYMNKYGYQENEEKGWHWNAVTFANVYAGLYLDELHTDLKTDGRWTYDDDYDW